MVFSPLNRLSATDTVMNAVRDAILTGRFLPGDRLPSERELADSLSVSRTSVRSAIGLLRAEGYLVSERGAYGGHRVASLKMPARQAMQDAKRRIEEYHHLMDFRDAIECASARAAAAHRTRSDILKIKTALRDLKRSADPFRFKKADSDFHLAVAEASRNPFFVRAIADTRARVFLLVGDFDDVVLETTYEAHAAVAKAIEARAPDEAEAAMRAHIAYSRDELIAGPSGALDAAVFAEAPVLT